VSGLSGASLGVVDSHYTVLCWKLSTAGGSFEHWANIDGIWYKAGSLVSTPNPLWASVGSGTLNLQSEASIRGAATWGALAAYGTTNYVFPNPANGWFYKCTTAGTSGASQPTWPTTLGATVADGSVVWTNQGIDAMYLDDLVYLPFAVPTSWLANLAAASQGWGALPNLACLGTGLGEGARTMRADSVSSQIFKAVLSGSFQVGRQLSVALKQV
jgi:hypothetical protein